MAHYHKILIIRRREFSSSRRPALALRDSMKNGSVAVVVPASIVVWADGGAANALTGEDVTEAYLKVQSAASRVSHAASETFNAAKEVADQDMHSVKPAVDFFTPYVRQSADYVYKAVFPVAVEHQKKAEKAIQSSGYDSQTFAKVKYRSILKVQSHQFQSILQNVLSSDPICAGHGSWSVVVSVFLGSSLCSRVSSVSTVARGSEGSDLMNYW